MDRWGRGELSEIAPQIRAERVVHDVHVRPTDPSGHQHRVDVENEVQQFLLGEFLPRVVLQTLLVVVVPAVESELLRALVIAQVASDEGIGRRGGGGMTPA